MDEYNQTELKLALNNAIWMHAPKTITLKEAEDAACKCIEHINRCYSNKNGSKME